MPSRKRRYSETSPTYGPKNFGAAVRQYLKENRYLVKAKKHQDFPWFVEYLEGWLENEGVWVDLEELSVRAQNTLRRMSVETLQVLYELWRQEDMITKPHCIGSLAKSLVPSIEARAQFMSALEEQCSVYRYQSLGSEPFYIPPVTRPDARHRPNRKRSELPDPQQPAWASVNRHKSRKFQITCRVDWHVKARIQATAHMMGQSQAAWVEAAIKNALVDHGYALPRRRPGHQDSDEPIKGRRSKRLELPNPELSRHASVNRADKTTTMRVSKDLLRSVDAARGPKDRSAWLNVVIREFIASGEVLLEPDHSGDAQSGNFGMRFDPDFFIKVQEAARGSGLTTSEWLRRVIRWKLEKAENT